MSQEKIAVQVFFEGKNLAISWPNGCIRIAEDFRYIYFTNDANGERKNYRINRFLPQKLEEKRYDAPFTLELKADPDFPGSQALETIKLNFGDSKTGYLYVIEKFNEAIERHQHLFPNYPNKQTIPIPLQPVQQRMAEVGEEITEFQHWDLDHPDNTEARRRCPERMYRQLIDGRPPSWVCNRWFKRRTQYYTHSHNYYAAKFEENQKLVEAMQSESPESPKKAKVEKSMNKPRSSSKRAVSSRRKSPEKKKEEKGREARMAYRTAAARKAPEAPKVRKRCRNVSGSSQGTSEPPPAKKKPRGTSRKRKSSPEKEDRPIWFTPPRKHRYPDPIPPMSPFCSFSPEDATPSPVMTPQRPSSPEEVVPLPPPPPPPPSSSSPPCASELSEETDSNINITMDELITPKIEQSQRDPNSTSPPIRRIMNTYISNSSISNAALWNCVVENSRLIGCKITSGPRNINQ
uniref:Homeobox domain-containing protein n=1 Tax=Caenorhabditis tropicalis TaxID=1561998 RepID=A0A1I7TTZ4_9PELO